MKNSIFLLLGTALLLSCSKTKNANEIVLPEGVVFMEAEATLSPLENWKLIQEGDTNYVANATGKAHLEFGANTINGGKPNSPLEYKFTVPADGTYRLLVQCRKRLEGMTSDKCNDGWVKLLGNYESGNEIPVEDLQSEEKFFGGEAMSWGWAETVDWQGHIKKPLLYKLKTGEEYTLVISGRSIRWNIDNIMFVDTEKVTLDSIKKIINPASFAEMENVKAWNINVEGYVQAYYDKDHAAFAINTVAQPTDQWAAAKKVFKGAEGEYDIKFTSLLETDGECSYKLLVDGNEVLSFQNPRIQGTDTKEYTPYIQEAKKVNLKNGSVIEVLFLSNSNGLVPEKDAFGYARARWQDLIIEKSL